MALTSQKKNDESAEKAEEPVKEESAEDVTEGVEVPDDGNEPAIVEPEEEPEVKEEPKKRGVCEHLKSGG